MITVFTERNKGIKRKLVNSALIESENNVMPVTAQWDTGATGSCISYDVVKSLNLIPISKKDIQTPSGRGIANQYLVNLILNKEVRIINLPVIDSCIGSQGIGILIGMDIISLGDFAVSNYMGNTFFSFRMPSQENIEYDKI